MGTETHHAIIVTGWGSNFKKVRARARISFPGLVTSVVKTKVEDYKTFLIGPDGSKEGWKLSNSYDAKRKRFFSYIDNLNKDITRRSKGFQHYIEIEYGDNGLQLTLNDNY